MPKASSQGPTGQYLGTFVLKNMIIIIFNVPLFPISIFNLHLIDYIISGKTYALMYLKATMIPLIRKYKLTADHKKMKLECKVMMKPISGHSVSIEERQY